MTTEFQQTDDAATCALDAYCSGLTNNTDRESNQARRGARRERRSAR